MLELSAVVLVVLRMVVAGRSLVLVVGGLVVPGAGSLAGRWAPRGMVRDTRVGARPQHFLLSLLTRVSDVLT